MSQFAARGYRFVGANSPARLSDGFRPQILPPFELLMERPSGEGPSATYRVIVNGSDAANGDSLSRARDDGFEFVGMYEDALVLERVGSVTRP